jgi:hypothetical protein
VGLTIFDSQRRPVSFPFESDVIATVMPRSAIVKAPCSACGENLQVRLDGDIRIHGPVSSRCPGSELLPSSQPNTSQDYPPLVSLPSHQNCAQLNPGHAYNKILKRIPRPARDVAATKLADILNDVCSNNNQEASNHLFLFSRRCLCVPPRGGIRHNLATFIQ